MPRLPDLLRAATSVVAVGTLCACSQTVKGGAGSGLPSFSSVANARFVSHVELDNGGLVVDPAGTITPRVSAPTARAMFRATDVVGGPYRYSVLGLGVVTVSTQVATAPPTAPGATTTTAAASAGGTPAGAATTSTTTTGTTTSANATTSSATTATTTSTTSSTTGTGTETTTAPPASAPVPVYNGRLAWVGIAWGVGCPAGASGSRTATQYVAVVFDAQTGNSALAYTSRGARQCNGPVLPASVSRPDELVSVPWQPVGPPSTSVRVTLPACASYYGWTEVAASGTNSVQVVARVPFDPTCPSKAPITQTVDGVVPLGKAQTQVPHAALGPIIGLRTLPGA